MGMLERHAKGLKRITARHGVDITLVDTDGKEYPIKALFNDVEHTIKIDNLVDPIGGRLVVYIDRDSLQTDTGEIKPADGWTLRGRANLYDTEATYLIEIDKSDRQLPGILLFLSPIKAEEAGWTV